MERPRLLWIDDDGPERFRYEEATLRSEWAIEWAPTVQAAAAQLRSTVYTAILIDQMLPQSEKRGPKDIWAGCSLLWWLTRNQLPPQLPDRQMYAKLLEVLALPANAEIPVCIVSAFDNPEVLRTMQRVRSKEVPLRPKPIALAELRRFLKDVRS